MHIRERARRRFVAWLAAQPRRPGPQAEVAKRLGITQPTISKWKGNGFEERHYERVAGLLGITVEELVAPMKGTAAPAQAKGESGVTSVTPAERTSPVTLPGQTSPTGEGEAKAVEGTGPMGARWAWSDDEVAALPPELQQEARMAVHEAALRVVKRFQRGVARRGHRDVRPRARAAR